MKYESFVSLTSDNLRKKNSFPVIKNGYIFLLRIRRQTRRRNEVIICLKWFEVV